jgi:hypothetical protein
MKLKCMSNELNQKNNVGGVRTPEGKAVSRYNAQRHGILRETVTQYEHVGAAELYNELSDDLLPHGRLQEVLVETIAANIIKLQRIAKAESELVREKIAPPMLKPLCSEHEYVPQITPAAAEQLILYSRYQTASENRIHRLLIILKQLQAYGSTI